MFVRDLLETKEPVYKYIRFHMNAQISQLCGKTVHVPICHIWKMRDLRTFNFDNLEGCYSDSN